MSAAKSLSALFKTLGQTLPSRLHRRACGFASPLPTAPVVDGGDENPGASAPLEMMSDAMDETLDKDEAGEETEELTNQVLDEIGVDVASQLSCAPKGRVGDSNKKAENNQARNAAPAKNVAPEPNAAEVDDLERRLASLRRI